LHLTVLVGQGARFMRSLFFGRLFLLILFFAAFELSNRLKKDHRSNHA